MASQIASIANDVRNIPLSQVLKRHGLEPHKEGNSIMWRGHAWAINVTGDTMFFDHKAGKGGSGAIDLEMHIRNVGFKEAVESLSGGKFIRFDTPPPPPPARKPLSEQMDEFAKRDDYRWPHAFGYLTRQRCLPPAVINDLHRSGRIYSNNRSGVVFLHYDPQGQVAGATIRSTIPNSKFSQCIGNKTGAWFTVGEPLQDCQKLAITESPIDAISYSVLHPNQHLCVVSIAGQYIPEALLHQVEGKQVILGLDNPAFERSEQAAAITRGIIETTMAKCPNAHIHTPAAKDWNDDLCAAKRHRLKL